MWGISQTGENIMRDYRENSVSDVIVGVSGVVIKGIVNVVKFIFRNIFDILDILIDCL